MEANERYGRRDYFRKLIISNAIDLGERVHEILQANPSSEDLKNAGVALQAVVTAFKATE